MGMAASQARLIELAARKTNVEYEGQQINQQRLNLANESAGMFNQLMNLNVPIPPSTEAFTKTVYKFSDGTTNYTIDKISEQSTSAQYNATINYYCDVTNYTGLYKEKNNLQISKRTDTTVVPNVDYYYYGTTRLKDYDASEDEAAVRQIAADKPDSYVGKNYLGTNVTKGSNPDGTTWKKYTAIDGTGYYTTDTYYASGRMKSSETYHDAQNYTTISYTDAATPAITYSGKINNVDVNTAADMLPKVSDTAAKQLDKIKSYSAGGQTYYLSLDQYNETSNVTTQPVQSCYACDYTTKEYKTTEAYLEKSESGRYTKVTLPGFSNSMDLASATSTDQLAYNDAMNEYNYQQKSYEKKVQDINAKTEVIQQEDRTLELKLRQLDTEQDALSTEMEAVKKVLDKNVETTFKTFQ